MEDKWFIFYENDWLYFHRSWTGFGIFKALLIKGQDGYSITEFWAERNQDKYSVEDDQSDIETLLFLINEGLLDIDTRESYIQNNIKTDVDLVKGWSNLGTLLFKNKDAENTDNLSDLTDSIKSVLFGVAVGDAIGVPVEFKSRATLRGNPVTDMFGFGTHHMPSGTFSDDSSLTFCLAEALTHDFDLNTIGQNFVKWCKKNYWTAGGNVFDIGITTLKAIYKLEIGIRPDLAGGTDIDSNGNGSLMRILPLFFYLRDKENNKRFEITKQVSSITHGHIRSVIACYYYLEFARQLFAHKDKFEIYHDLKNEITDAIRLFSGAPSEDDVFHRLLKGDIHKLPEERIQSSGYVVHTLEASIWCLLTTDNYHDAVLKAVNLGEDTDTTGAVTGGLAGLLYGHETIPKNWIETLARKDDINDLAKRLGNKISGTDQVKSHL
ncbi:MAG: ADP-ribosylglycohydrolase family protein [Mariniphaga sp.]|nr:ADP-ribosylglycohydrolase family protein [Mariniphaga sp.]